MDRSFGLLRWYSTVITPEWQFKSLMWVNVYHYFLHVWCWDRGGSDAAFFILSLNFSLDLFHRWGHLAPTCPDTIGCFPYYEQDPFILDTLPDVFIAGNQVGWKFLFFLNVCEIFSQFFEVSASISGFNQIRALFGLFRQNVSGKTVPWLWSEPSSSALVSIRTPDFVVRIPGTDPVSDGYEYAFPLRNLIQVKISMLIQIQVRTKARIWNWRLHIISHFDYVWFFFFLIKKS